MSQQPARGRRRAEIDAEIEAEFHFHLEALTRELEAEGMSPGEAAQEASRRFGDLEQFAASCRREAPEERTKLFVRTGIAITIVTLLAVTWIDGWREAQGHPLHEELLLHLAYGFPLALAAGMRIPFARGWLRRIGLLVAGSVCFWLSLFLGTHIGYGAWQSMPNPPEEAYADGAKLMFALMAGWLPGAVLVLGTAIVTAVCRALLRLILRAP